MGVARFVEGQAVLAAHYPKDDQVHLTSVKQYLTKETTRLTVGSHNAFSMDCLVINHLAGL
jgi:hypothetical protein